MLKVQRGEMSEGAEADERTRGEDEQKETKKGEDTWVRV